MQRSTLGPSPAMGDLRDLYDMTPAKLKELEAEAQHMEDSMKKIAAQLSGNQLDTLGKKAATKQYEYLESSLEWKRYSISSGKAKINNTIPSFVKGCSG